MIHKSFKIYGTILEFSLSGVFFLVLNRLLHPELISALVNAGELTDLNFF